MVPRISACTHFRVRVPFSLRCRIDLNLLGEQDLSSTNHVCIERREADKAPNQNPAEANKVGPACRSCDIYFHRHRPMLNAVVGCVLAWP